MTRTQAVDMREFRHHQVRFVPKGPVIEVGSTDHAKHNPVERQPVVPLTARLFVGLNVGSVPTWSVEDVIRITQRVRLEQKSAPDASFVLQRGLYTDKSENIVKEDSVQVVVFNFGDAEDEFEQQMIGLAEALIHELQQEVIYVELQRNGVPYIVLKATP